MASQVIYGSGLFLILLQISLSYAQEKPTCGGKENCISFPKDCKLDSCDLVADFERNADGSVKFTVNGKVPAKSYVAVGLSKDASMGKDAVVACFSDGIKTFINPGDHNPAVFQAWKSGSPTTPTFAYAQNHLICSFVLPNKVDAGDGISFDLSEQVNILLVSGPAEADNKLSHHNIRTTGIISASSQGGNKSMASSIFGHASASFVVILSSIAAVSLFVSRNL